MTCTINFTLAHLFMQLKISPGLETISNLQFGLYFTTLGMMNLKIFTLRWTRLRRLSPSC